jgi:hypothetical protein
MAAAQQVPKTAARQPVGTKALFFDGQQGRNIIQGGKTRHGIQESPETVGSGMKVKRGHGLGMVARTSAGRLPTIVVIIAQH